MLCGENSLVKSIGDGQVAVSLRCRAWNCETCAPVRKRQLIDLALAGRPNKLITLTINPRVGISPADRAGRLARAWRIAVKRLRRAYGADKVEYLAVVERTKRGEPHLHILARAPFIAQRVLSNMMKELIHSPIVDIRQIQHGTGAARYVAKYIGKDPHRFATCKRYWKSKGYAPGHIEDEHDASWGKGGWEQHDKQAWRIYSEWMWQDKHPWWSPTGVAGWGVPPPVVEDRAGAPGGGYATQPAAAGALRTDTTRPARCQSHGAAS